ncbi:collagen-like protein [Nocardioides sp. 503]|uniref:collagen-like protein n=1 Tax=Nocardioides sp. 503 TaxID=2508326 RepID=UPI0010704096|nr:collagen-like protein [Nocardioides sp. 503]
MNTSLSRPALIVLAAAVLVAGASTVGYAVASGGTVKACVTGSSLVVAPKTNGRCAKGAKLKAISVQGPRGAAGPRGPVGPDGPTGPQGPGSTDFDVYLTEGPYSIAQTEKFGVYANCNVYGATFYLLQKDNTTDMRVAGMVGYGTTAPSVYRQESSELSLFLPYAAGSYHPTTYFDGIVTDLASGTSVHLTLNGAKDGAYCRYDGQITP